MAKTSRRYCLCCKKLFQLNARNAGRQKYCSTPKCRKASKAASQKGWLNKPENKNYFCGPAHVARVQHWRKQNPRYSQKVSKLPCALQEVVKSEQIEQQEVAPKLVRHALQDLIISQDLILVGLISILVDSPLQETIANTVLQMLSRGRDVLGMKPEAPSQENHENQKASASSASAAASAKTVQLDRSQAGSSG